MSEIKTFAVKTDTDFIQNCTRSERTMLNLIGTEKLTANEIFEKISKSSTTLAIVRTTLCSLINKGLLKSEKMFPLRSASKKKITYYSKTFSMVNSTSAFLDK